jgi:pimeloyl-ACP methyl ester carboxylesterase
MAEFLSSSPGLFGRGVTIAFEEVGRGVPIVLVHGFASNRVTNWKRPGWYETLTRAGRRVIALDCRGHGESEKPHDEKAYDERVMARDVIHLLDHLGIKMAEVMGYSMGGFITLDLLMEHPQRFGRAVIGGVGENYFAPVTVNVDSVVEALLAPSAEAIADPVSRQFRTFAESQGNDLQALAACFRRKRKPYGLDQLAQITHQVLVVAGDKDAMIGSPQALANAIPNAKLVLVKDRDHMLTVGDKVYKDAVTDFLTA